MGIARLGSMERLLCMRLRTVSLIVGWLGIVFGIIGTILMFVVFAKLDEISQAFADKSTDPDAAQTASTFVLVVAVVYFVLNLISLGISILLVLGTKEERPSFILPWIIFCGIGVAFCALSVVLNFFGLIFSGVKIASFISSVLIFVIQFFIWNAVYSHYKQVKASKEHQQNTTTAADPSAPTVYHGLSKI